MRLGIVYRGYNKKFKTIRDNTLKIVLYKDIFSILVILLIRNNKLIGFYNHSFCKMSSL